jgi:hypothetical protein
MEEFLVEGAVEHPADSRELSVDGAVIDDQGKGVALLDLKPADPVGPSGPR